MRETTISPSETIWTVDADEWEDDAARAQIKAEAASVAAGRAGDPDGTTVWIHDDDGIVLEHFPRSASTRGPSAGRRASDP